MTTQIKEKYKFQLNTHNWFNYEWFVSFDWKPTLDELLDEVAEDINATSLRHTKRKFTPTRMNELLEWENITIWYKKDDMDEYEQITDIDWFY